MLSLLLGLILLTCGFVVGRWSAGRQLDQSLAMTRSVAAEQAEVLAVAQRINHRAFMAQSVMHAQQYHVGDHHG